MTGQLVLIKGDGERFAGGHPTGSMAGELPDRSTRLVFELESGDKLYFNDQRKFVTVEYLAAQLKRHKGAMIKPVILDQSVIAGIGNIYADESLHLAKIHPARRAGSLTGDEVRRLHDALRETMRLGIEHGGTSFSNYVNALGGQGDYLQHARVFRRQGLACPVCGTMIEKIKLAGRGTHFCPHCQPAPAGFVVEK
jgi:formamidopyrimidine-DNA glycosylase